MSNPSNGNSSYKAQIKSRLGKLKNDQIQNVKVDLTRIIIKTLAPRIDVLSDDVKLCMMLLTSKDIMPLMPEL